jgi:hypothetical protein
MHPGVIPEFTLFLFSFIKILYNEEKKKEEVRKLSFQLFYFFLSFLCFTRRNLNLEKLTLKKAKEIVGLISHQNSKLNCANFSFPSTRCNQGNILKNINNSVCSKCYSDGIEKRWKCTINAWENNYQKYINSNREEWVTAFSLLLNSAVKKTTNENLFRWFPSGDIPDEEFLIRAIEIAKLNKHINFWLPTKEYNLIKNFNYTIPDNLTIRLSCFMINEKPNFDIKIPTSSVSTKDNPNKLKGNCQATFNKTSCDGCTNCWNKKVKNINYLLH